MAYVECSAHSPKLGIVSAPWNDDDYSMKNRASLGIYADSLNAGFTAFLNHPSEVGKKIEMNGKQRKLASIPVMIRMDRVRMQMIFDALLRLCHHKASRGLMLKCYNNVYKDNGEVILTDGNKKPLHSSTIVVFKDADGVICIRMREEEHEGRTKRPGVQFKIRSNMWFKACDVDGNELTPDKDSRKTTRALVQQWKSAMDECLHDNYEIFKKEKEAKRQKWLEENGLAEPKAKAKDKSEKEPEW